MEEGVDAGGEVVRSMSSLRMSIGSLSRRSWVSAGVSEVWGAGHGGDVFDRSTRVDCGDDDDEEELKWAAIERLPTFERLRKSLVKRVLEESGRFNYEEVDVSNLGFQDKKKLLHAILTTVQQDNERFLRSMRERIDRVAIEIPKVEVRFENLFVEGDAFNGSRALPTLVNSTMNAMERILGSVNLLPSKKSVIKILQGVSGIVKPARLTLLLGPPRSGKTTLLQALAGKLDKDLRVSGRVTYCGHELSEFVPQRTCAYISQHNLHHGEMTVRETLDFSGRCLGVGTRHELLDQEQYWFARDKPYQYVSVPEFVSHFNNFGIGQQLSQELQVPYDRAKTHPAALVKDKYGISKLELLKACFAREWLLMKRSYAPAASRFFGQLLAFVCVHQMGISLFRFIAALGRTQVVANTFGFFVLLLFYVLGGFIIAKGEPHYSFAFSTQLPNKDRRIPGHTVGEALLKLLLMKRGGQLIYNGPLGQQSQKLIEYFEAIPGVPKIKDGYNPATWALEISSPEVESQLCVDFAELYTKSELYHLQKLKLSAASHVLQKIPIWWRWYYWVCPTAWSLYGLVTSQVGDKTNTILVPGSISLSVKAYLREEFDYEYGFLGVVVVALVAFVTLFLFVFAYGIKVLNFQKR
ncbi:hypothetical protein ACSQ67_014395 [Phaseolus vulgaris]